MTDAVKADRVNAVAESIDGATGDWSMSGDAMRWSPDLAAGGPAAAELRGVDVAAGLGAGLGLDMTGMRRLERCRHRVPPTHPRGRRGRRLTSAGWVSARLAPSGG